MKLNNLLKLIIAMALSLSAGFVGSIFTTPTITTWYAGLAKPALNPPAWIFGPVWTVLYILIGVSLWLVWTKDFKVKHHILTKGHKAWNTWSHKLWLGEWQTHNTILIFGFKLILNATWSVVFFGLQSPATALIIIIALWLTILFTIINFYRVSKTAAYLLVPYILWVSFATYLNLAIWLLN